MIRVIRGSGRTAACARSPPLSGLHHAVPARALGPVERLVRTVEHLLDALVAGPDLGHAQGDREGDFRVVHPDRKLGERPAQPFGHLRPLVPGMTEYSRWTPWTMMGPE